MEESRPSVFIGSSSEALYVARAVQNQLAGEAYTDVWKFKEGAVNSTIIEWLIDATWDYDFAVMIFSPDDQATSREKTFRVARDNVVFELGLFMGRLGRARTFIVEEMGAELKRPSDLGGVLTLRYEKRGYQKADVSVACNHIIDQMQSQGRWNGTSRDHDEPSLKEKVSRLRMMLDGKGFSPDLIMGVSRGGLAVAALLSKQIGGAPRVPTMSLSPYPGFDNDFNRFAFKRKIFRKAGVIQILIVDDVCRQGKTLYDADSHVRRSIKFPDVQIATAALTCYERVRSFDPTFIVETLGEPIERFGGDVEPFYS